MLLIRLAQLREAYNSYLTVLASQVSSSPKEQAFFILNNLDLVQASVGRLQVQKGIENKLKVEDDLTN